MVATKTTLMSQQNTMLLPLVFGKWCQRAKNYQENINQSLSLSSLLLLSTKHSPTLHSIAFDFIVKTKNSLSNRPRSAVWKRRRTKTTTMLAEIHFFGCCTHLFSGTFDCWTQFEYSWLHMVCRLHGRVRAEIFGLCVCVACVCTINCCSQKPFEL